MSAEMSEMEFLCRACSWRETCGPQEMTEKLRSLGFLRREKKPDAATVRELLTGAGPRLCCPDCGEEGLVIQPVREEDDEWQDAVLCDVCRKPIPPERLEAIPGTRRCTACQEDNEAGRFKEEPDFCPRCGALLVLKMSSGRGTTRFKMFCTGSPPCRL